MKGPASTDSDRARGLQTIISRSGRGAEPLIDEGAAATMTATAAHRFIQAAPWRIVDGSLYGHAGKRVESGPDFGTPPDPAAH
jgi:hypothetical protein